MSIINIERASILKPSAHITINKSRTKAYGSTVCLKTGTSFEIELYNPTQLLFLAKVKINGSYISQAGIIIKPGQRIFLERFIDNQKKFKFETYEVEGASPEILKAIANNGDIIVEFYPEKLKTQNSTSWLLAGSTGHTVVTPTLLNRDDWWYGFTTTNNVGIEYRTNTSFGGSTVNNVSINVAGSFETGRIEVGETSNQQLVETFGEFSNFMVAQSVWKILPLSLKPIEVGEIRQYCTGCRTRIKKSSWKFCPTCGEGLID